MNVHKSVLLQETIDGLDLKNGDVFLDCTTGGAGHSLEIVNRFGRDVKIICIDEDEDALERAEKELSKVNADFVTKKANFRSLDWVLDELGYKQIDKILFDLGLSSNQLELSGRGFSFNKEEPIIMTFGKSNSPSGVSARDIVNSWKEEDIANLIYQYGEERFSRRIAKGIIEFRKKEAIETTSQLALIVRDAVPFWYGKRKINPATKTFQALRIAVNDEVEALKEGLTKGFDRLKPQGRMIVISFHSIEDRIVKTFYKELHKTEKGILVVKKPIVPTREEIEVNKRSRSAKLRIIEKI